MKQSFKCMSTIKQRLATQSVEATFASNTTIMSTEWNEARPYESIPSPKRIYWSLLPGGKLYGKSIADIQRSFNQEYGDILRIPGVFGRPDFVFIFDPNDYATVFRTEGQWPMRLGLPSLMYYRKKMRNDFFCENSGLLIE